VRTTFVRETDRRRIKAGRPRSLAATTEVRECPRHGIAPFHRIRDGKRYRWQGSHCVGERVTARHRFISDPRPVSAPALGGEA
jgi:hypothetical protein